MPEVRAADPADRGQVLRTVVTAFDGDPAWGWICGANYDRVAPLFAGALFDARVDAGTVWVTSDGAAVSMWDGPDAEDDHGGLWAQFRAGAGPEVWRRLDRYDSALRAHRPSEPIWYLGVLATDPTRREEGLAGAVMKPGLERADSAGLKACLETSTVENKRFYAKRGFTELAEVDLASGPPTWWLTRQPDQAQRSHD